MTMTYSKFLITPAFVAVMAFACVQSANAQTTVNFTTLSSGDGIGNTLQANGSTANLTVAQSFVGGDFLYAISYSGLDFDGVAGLDTLSFTVKVDTILNGTVAYSATPNTSTASLGVTAADTLISSTNGNIGSWVNLTDLMRSNSSMIFTVQDASVSTGQDVDPVSFTGLFMKEGRSLNHQTVVGLGTDLPGYVYNNDLDISVSPGVSTLYVSNGKGANDAVGVRDVDFSITVAAVPEPSSYALFGGLLALGTVMLRRLQ
jgi:hypothetical protein